MQEINLMENWSETKEALLDGLTAEKRTLTAALLENERQHLLKESAAAGATNAHNIAGFRTTLLPLLRRVIPGTIATEIVGTQAMKGPVSQVFSMRYVYAENMNADGTNAAFGAENITAGDEAFGNLKPVRQFYAGSTGAAQAAGASGIGPGAPGDIGANTATGQAWPSSLDATTYDTGTMTFGSLSIPVGGSLRGGSNSFIEGSGGRKMTLEVVAQTVEAGARKLQAGMTFEAIQDANSQHGIDITAEMLKGMAAELVQEIDAEIINDLVSLAGTVRAFDFSTTGAPNYAPAFVGDRMANIGSVIGSVANEIARKTRRGAGNFIVVSPMMVTVLQTAAKAVFSPAVEGSFKGPNNTELVGTLNGNIKVYSYLWNQAQPGTSAPLGSDTILVGYYGGNTDAGYYYAPYVPIMSTGVITHPVTMQPVVSLMTRYGKVAFTDPTTSLGNSADYYGKINVTNLDFV